MLREIRVIVHEQPHPPPKKWLKTKEVRQLLGVCPATLQALRDNGTIPYSKLGSNFFLRPRRHQPRAGATKNRWPQPVRSIHQRQHQKKEIAYGQQTDALYQFYAADHPGRESVFQPERYARA
ncbi:helix-turn-helix domain-containing protein [Dinghuibacter silviterrae]|uniref:helix-turn-helix domain-containing protein n=1 Tax=Dinghuibacter silviterrae TaxID=1539049 RepID=UPI003744208C